MIWRYRFLLISFFFAFLLVVVRLFYWQVVKAEELSQLGANQYGQYIKVSPKRGEIETTDGFPLVSNKINYLLYANPREISKSSKKTQLIDSLSSILELDVASISAALNKDSFWSPIKPNLSTELKDKIDKKDFPGIGFEEQYTRFYPEGSMAAHLTGFVGKNDNGEQKGYYGLEGYYNSQLGGKAGYASQILDALGKPVLSRLTGNLGKVDGRTLELSIERPIQFMVEKILKEGMEKYQAQGATVIVVNPKTGGVLGMVSFPSFDQAKYDEYEDHLYKNPMITNFYEPGSTFKSLIMSAGIDAGVVKADTKCTICDGPVAIGEYEIRTWNNKYTAGSTMVDVIQHSDNTGMVFVARKLGLEKMMHYLKAYGIGETTGIDLQGEAAPSIRPKDEWYPIDLATASFGQGISVTPIELITAFASLANGGKRMEPHVVAKIRTPEGKEIPIEPKVINQPISDKTTKIMTEILVNAVDQGEAKWAKPKGYRIAGKTGTSQIPIAGHYDPNKTIASFVGFAPADDPKFAALVIFDRPTTSIYGSETAAPVFFKIAKYILNYYKIPPTQSE